MSRQGLVATLLLVLAAAAGTGWFLVEFEQAEETVVTGYRGEALANPLLAAERWLRAIGTPVSELESLAALEGLPPGGVLMLAVSRRTMTPDSIETVLDWVDRGGTLVVEAAAPGIEDPLADALGVLRERVRAAPDAGKKVPGKARKDSPPGAPAGAPAELPAEAGEGRTAANPARTYVLPWRTEVPLRLVLPPGPSLRLRSGQPEFALGDKDRAVLIGFDRGTGRVIVCNGFRPFRNRGIGEADNALLLRELVQRDGVGRTLHVFRIPLRLSPWSWLGSHATWAVAAAALLAAAWLWRTLVRSGPILPDPAPARRRWADHLEASGRFLWRRNQRPVLLARARAAALGALERQRPGFGRLADEARRQLLVREFGFSPVTPLAAAGRRMEPPVSVPSAP